MACSCSVEVFSAHPQPPPFREHRCTVGVTPPPPPRQGGGDVGAPARACAVEVWSWSSCEVSEMSWRSDDLHSVSSDLLSHFFATSTLPPFSSPLTADILANSPPTTMAWSLFDSTRTGTSSACCAAEDHTIQKCISSQSVVTRAQLRRARLPLDQGTALVEPPRSSELSGCSVLGVASPPLALDDSVDDTL